MFFSVGLLSGGAHEGASRIVEQDMDRLFDKARYGEATARYMTHEEVVRDKEKQQYTHTHQ